MKDPALGPFLFDTSADVVLAGSRDPAIVAWRTRYAELHAKYVSSVTLLEKIRGFSLAWQRFPEHRFAIEKNRQEYLLTVERVVPFCDGAAMVAAEIMALVPNPPLRRKLSHRQIETRGERLSRWRFDVMIAATALITGMTLIHNNADDFETIRGAIERTPARFPKLGPLDLVRCHAVA